MYDTSDFSLVANITLAGAGDATLVNDVIVTDTAAFFTETLQPQLYKVGTCALAWASQSRLLGMHAAIGVQLIMFPRLLT